jgi:hypothetical protein
MISVASVAPAAVTVPVVVALVGATKVQLIPSCHPAFASRSGACPEVSGPKNQGRRNSKKPHHDLPPVLALQQNISCMIANRKQSAAK